MSVVRTRARAGLARTSTAVARLTATRGPATVGSARIADPERMTAGPPPPVTAGRA
jgi:hypothetical protein